MYGYTLLECASLIIDVVREDAGEAPVSEILHYILVDTKNCEYCFPIEREKIAKLGIKLIDVQLVADHKVVESKSSSSTDEFNVSELKGDNLVLTAHLKTAFLALTKSWRSFSHSDHSHHQLASNKTVMAYTNGISGIQ